MLDGMQDLGVLHRRIMSLVDQVELDLQPGQRTFEVELGLLEHSGEHVQAPPDFGSVQLPVLPSELRVVDIVAHTSSFDPREYELGRGSGGVNAPSPWHGSMPG